MPVGRIGPWGQALGARRWQRGGTWHPGLPGRPRHGGHQPSVPAPRDLLLARAGRASSIRCQHRGRQNTHRYGVQRRGMWGDAVERGTAGWSLRTWVAAASQGWAGCGRQPSLVGAGCICTCGYVRAHTPVPVAGPGSVSPQFGAAPRAPPGLSEPAPGAVTASLLPPQLVRSLPGDTATRKVAGGLRRQAGCDSKRGDVPEVSGGPHPPLGACFGDPPLLRVVGAGGAVVPVPRNAGRDAGPSVVSQRAGEVWCPHGGEGHPVVSVAVTTLGGRGQRSLSGGCHCGGSPPSGNRRQVGQGWHGVMPSVPLQGTSSFGFQLSLGRPGGPDAGWG